MKATKRRFMRASAAAITGLLLAARRAASATTAPAAAPGSAGGSAAPGDALAPAPSPSPQAQPAASTSTFDVTAFGAVGDGLADDTWAIQSAVNACSAAGGGRVFLPSGRYRITSSIRVATADIEIVGCGNASNSNGGTSRAATTLVWDGAGGGRMLILAPQSGTTSSALYRPTVRQIKFDGSFGKAGGGILLQSAKFGVFQDLTFYNCSVTAIAINVVGVLAASEPRDTQNCVFENIVSRSNDIGVGSALVLNGDAGANASYNVFRNFLILHGTNHAIVLLNGDNNSFEDIRTFAGGTVRGYGLVLDQSAAGAFVVNNRFTHVSFDNGGIQQNGADHNSFFGYDRSQGQPAFTVASGAVDMHEEGLAGRGFSPARLSGDGAGLKHAVSPTPSLPPGATAIVSIRWTTPFGSDAYHVSVTTVDALGRIQVLAVTAITATAVSVKVKNTSAADFATGFVHVIAVLG